MKTISCKPYFWQPKNYAWKSGEMEKYVIFSFLYQPLGSGHTKRGLLEAILKFAN